MTERLPLLRSLAWSLAALAVLAILMVIRDGDPTIRAVAEGLAYWSSWTVIALFVVLLVRTLPLRRGSGPAATFVYGVAAAATVVVQRTLLALAEAGTRWLTGSAFPAGERMPVVFELVVFAALAAGLNAAGATADRRRRERIELELRSHLERARLDALAQQIAPHFLFNALNTIAGLIPSDPRRAEQLLDRLALLLHHTLRDDPGIPAPVEAEIAFVQSYLDIQQARFGDRLGVRIAVQREAESCLMPPFTLQPIVENVVVHALRRSAEPVHLAIEVRIADEVMIATVTDDGPGFSMTRMAGGTGIDGIRERLRLLYGDRASLRIESRPGAGTTATLQLPVVLLPAAHRCAS